MAPRWTDGDPDAALAAAVRAVGEVDPPPDLVLLTGDVADHGADAEYARVRELLAELPAPVHVLPGNHDDRAVLRRHFDLPGAGGEPIQYAVEGDSLRVLMLDTTIPGSDAGALDGGRLDWLQSALDAAPQTPTILAMHHPPLRTGIPALDELPLADADQAALADIVRAHGQVRLITGGHVHRACTAGLGGCPVLAVPSTYAQARLTFGRPELEFGEDPAGFALTCCSGIGSCRTSSRSDAWPEPRRAGPGRPDAAGDAAVPRAPRGGRAGGVESNNSDGTRVNAFVSSFCRSSAYNDDRSERPAMRSSFFRRAWPARGRFATPSVVNSTRDPARAAAARQHAAASRPAAARDHAPAAPRDATARAAAAAAARRTTTPTLKRKQPARPRGPHRLFGAIDLRRGPTRRPRCPRPRSRRRGRAPRRRSRPRRPRPPASASRPARRSSA